VLDTLGNLGKPSMTIQKPEGAPNPKQCRRRFVKAAEQIIANNHLSARLSGISPLDCHSGGVAVFTAFPVVKVDAPDFKSVIGTIGTHYKTGTFSEEDMQLISGEQMQRVSDFNLCLKRTGSDCQPIILVHHSIKSETQTHDGDVHFAALSNMIEVVNGFVLGQSKGIKLACDIRSEIMRQMGRTNAVIRSVEEHRERADRVSFIKDNLHDMVWWYTQPNSLAMHFAQLLECPRRSVNISTQRLVHTAY